MLELPVCRAECMEDKVGGGEVDMNEGVTETQS